MNHLNKLFQNNYLELLDCNKNRERLSESVSDTEIESELEVYHQSTFKKTNYDTVPTLDEWKEEVTPHKFASEIAKYSKLLSCKNICEIGAGCGNICKWVKFSNPVANVTAVENDDGHFRLLTNNIIDTPNYLEPHGKFDITLLQQSAHKLDFADKQFDMVYTCTVMMHIPFLPQLGILCELSRISSKYIMHVENVVACTVIGDMKNLHLNTRTTDYEKAYGLLGYHTLVSEVGEYPNEPGHHYILYIAERNSE
jgi:predicted RNA methylase